MRVLHNVAAQSVGRRIQCRPCRIVRLTGPEGRATTYTFAPTRAPSRSRRHPSPPHRIERAVGAHANASISISTRNLDNRLAARGDRIAVRCIAWRLEVVLARSRYRGRRMTFAEMTSCRGRR